MDDDTKQWVHDNVLPFVYAALFGIGLILALTYC